LKGNVSIARRTAIGIRLVGMAAAVLVAAVAFCVGGSESARAASSLHVCADPDNMPFSNNKGEGFENKIAELIAERLGHELDYAWFENKTGFVPNTKGEDGCDLVMGYAQGTGLIEDTNPYYYTSYVLIYRHDDADIEDVESLADLRLKQRRIGILARTPPASMLAMHGLGSNAKVFETFVGGSMSKAAEAMIAEIASGKLDAGILWGPVGGYYAQRAGVPLSLLPLVKETAGPSTIYAITLGVRPDEPQWKHQINKVLAENQHDINVILQGYNVPLLDQDGELIAGEAGR
jgi:mxaJ protein